MRLTKDADDPDSGRYPGAVWFRYPRKPHPSAVLSRERIAEAAVELLAEEGLDGFQLRKLAAAMGVKAPSFYKHVASNGDILDLALDLVLGQVPLPGKPGELWREDIARFMRDLRLVLLSHPWSAPLAGLRPLVGPNALACSEHLRSQLTRAGLIGSDVVAGGQAVVAFVVGTVAAEISWPHDGEHPARQALARYLRQNASRYPTLAADQPLLEIDWNERFERGRAIVLDGLAR